MDGDDATTGTVARRRAPSREEAARPRSGTATTPGAAGPAGPRRAPAGVATATGPERRPAGVSRAERATGADRPDRPDRWKTIFVSLLVVGILAVVAWVLLGSRLLVVRHVQVAGTRLVAQEQVLAAARVRIGVPMIRLDTGSVEARVAAVRGVESVTVVRRWPATVRVVVKERVPVVSVERGGRFYELDRFGETVLDTAVRPVGLPALLTAAPGPGDAATRAALEVRRSLPERYLTRLAVIEAATPESVTLRMRSGATVVWGSPERPQEKLKLIDALLGTATGRAARTIDVSSPEVVTTQ